MGIKKFYLYLKKSHNWVFVKDHNELKVDCLAIDCNAIIHNIAHKVYIDDFDVFLNPSKYEKITIKETVKKIDELKNTYGPNTLIVALDGVPPMSKIKQQRSRRIPDDIRPLNQQPKPRYIASNGWSSSTVSVGTKFMDKMSSKIKEYLEELDINYIYSSHRSPGEGEHKIMSYLREYNFDKTLFYSPDSDILLLSMTLDNQIYVRTDAYIEKEDILITDITKLRKSFNININDLILISFLSGNDFLPPIPEFDNIDGSMPILLDIYKLFSKKLTTENNIIWNNLKDFMLMCMKHRSAFIYPKEERYVNIRIKDKIDFSLFDFIYNKEKEDYNMKEICKYYFQALYWNFEYYLGHKYDTSFQFPYSHEYTPTLSVLLDNFVEGEFEIEHTTFLRPIETLASIIPYTDFYLLPLKARKIAVELEDQYPIQNATIIYFERVRNHWAQYKDLFKEENEKEKDIINIE